MEARIVLLMVLSALLVSCVPRAPISVVDRTSPPSPPGTSSSTTVSTSIPDTTIGTAAAGRVVVHDQGHYLAQEDGRPFFYLADTAWMLFRVEREGVDIYLEDRAARGFTVIQASLLTLEWWEDTRNDYGDLPFPEGREFLELDEAYWRHVDYVVQRAGELDLHLALVPAWAKRYAEDGSLTPSKAMTYGNLLAERYADQDHIIWALGGDNPADQPRTQRIWRQLARAITAGSAGENDYSRTLMTYHPSPNPGSSEWFHEDPWLDFNMIQTGHLHSRTNYQDIAHDYALMPPKPALDGEPSYEGSEPGCPQCRLVTPEVIRRQAYWALFAGAHGLSYGHDSIWPMWEPGLETDRLGERPSWKAVLDAPGALQIQHARRLIESRSYLPASESPAPYFNRMPDQSLVVSDPGTGIRRVQASRDAAGSYAFVYLPVSRSVTVDLSAITGEAVQVWWFNPRNGQSDELGEYSTSGPRSFEPPTEDDWVLVLDAAEAGYPPPGS
jgi:hypothetical protein